MRILLVYSNTNTSVTEWYEEVASVAPPHLQVRCFPLTIPGFKTHMAWETLDLAWRCRHPAVMKVYSELQKEAAAADVLLLYNGYNLHPDMLSYLSTFNVFCFFDDPESSELCSRYIAPAFDAVFYGNVAARFQYLDWGCRRMAYLPVFTAPRDIPSPRERSSLLSCPRDNNILLCCSWQRGGWRHRRLQKLYTSFPDARCYGRGWPSGFIPQEQLHDLCRRSRIGWNVHNSTGPINKRLFILAAWNILQICDNKTGLGRVFQLGREIIGFDTIDEAIEKTRYFLAHEDERKKIAKRAFQRYWREYRPEALWQRIEQQINAWHHDLPVRSSDTYLTLPSEHSTLSRLSYTIHAVPQSLHNTINRWHISVLKRSARETWPIDERFYLSTSVSYNPQKSLHKQRRICTQQGSGHNPMIEQQVLAWAATTLIGKTQCISVFGKDIADYFITYATADPDRVIQRYIGSWKDISVRNDFHNVIFAFEQNAKELLTSTGRLRDILCTHKCCVFGFTDQQVAWLGGTNTLYTLVGERFPGVSLFWLPNPVVPWIEPLSGPREGVSVLIYGYSIIKRGNKDEDSTTS